MFGKFFSKEPDKRDRKLSAEQYEFLDNLIDRYSSLLYSYECEIRGYDCSVNFEVIIEGIFRDYLFDKKSFKRSRETYEGKKASSNRAMRKFVRVINKMYDDMEEFR